jgi:hypothetical protein
MKGLSGRRTGRERGFAGGEKTEQKDLTGREFSLKVSHHTGDADGGVGRRDEAEVVDADEEDDDFGVVPFEFALLDAPELVLNFVAADAEVHGVVFAVEFIEDTAIPSLRYGVAKEA